MKKTILLLSFAQILHSQNPQFAWVKSMGSSGADEGKAITVDVSGNVYTTGNFEGVVDFDPGAGTFNLTSNGSKDIYVSKLDANGNFVWAVSMGGSGIGNEAGSAIVLDAANNVYITGLFNGTVDFDPSVAVSNLTGSFNSFVLKLSASGGFVWAKSLGGTGSEYGKSIALDNLGNVYTTGFFEGTADFDPSASVFNLVSGAFSDIFISKLDGAGNFVWAKGLNGITDYDEGFGITIDALNNVLLTGKFGGTVDFDPSPSTYTLASTNYGNHDIFIAKYTSAGALTWAKRIGGTSPLYDEGEGIVTDASNNVYCTGHFVGTVDFDPNASVFNLVSNGSQDAFILKLDASGNFVWAKKIGGTANDWGNSIAIDATGNVYTTGFFSNTVDFNPGASIFNLVSNGSFDAFISELDANGDFIMAKSFGGSSADQAESIAIDALSNIHTTGNYQSTVDFDPNGSVFNLSSVGSTDAFIHKLSPCIAPPSPTNITPPSNQVLCANGSASLTVSSSYTVNWFSSFTNTTSLNSGTIYITPSLTAGNYTYYAEASSCDVSIRTPVTLTAHPLPNIAITSSTNNLCIGDNATLTASGANNYTWVTNSNSASIIVSPSVTTNYFVTGTDANGCSATFNIMQSVVDCAITDIKNTALTKGTWQLKFYPNPTNGKFIIDSESQTQILITNFLGQLVCIKKIEAGKNEIDLTDLNKGIYFVRSGDATFKLVIQK